MSILSPTKLIKILSLMVLCILYTVSFFVNPLTFSSVILLGYLWNKIVILIFEIYLSLRLIWFFLFCQSLVIKYEYFFCRNEIKVIQRFWEIPKFCYAGIFLAHLTQRVRWAIAITFRPSSVRQHFTF